MASKTLSACLGCRSTSLGSNKGVDYPEFEIVVYHADNDRLLTAGIDADGRRPTGKSAPIKDDEP